jgi:hypothetical protein
VARHLRLACYAKEVVSFDDTKCSMIVPA